MTIGERVHSLYCPRVAMGPRGRKADRPFLRSAHAPQEDRYQGFVGASLPGPVIRGWAATFCSRGAQAQPIPGEK